MNNHTYILYSDLIICKLFLIRLSSFLFCFFKYNCAFYTIENHIFISYLTGTTVSVNEVADWAGDRYYVKGQGQSWTLFPDAASHWGCQARQAGSVQEVIAALESGCPVIASMGPGHFTSAGHFIVLCGTTSDGYLIVNDPNLHNYNHHGDTVPADWVWSEAKGYFILSGGQ